MKSLRNNSFLHNAGWMVAGNVVSYAIQASYFVFAARLLGVLQYGIYAGATALISIASQYSTFGSGFLFLRYVSGDRSKFAAYWGNILFATAAVGGTLVVLTHLFGSRIVSGDTGPLLIFIAIGDCICAQLTQCCAQIFQAFEKMKYTAGLTVVTSLLRLTMVFALFAHGPHVTVNVWAFWQMCISIVAAAMAVCLVFSRYGLPKWQSGLFRKHALEAATFAFSCSTTSAYNDIDKTMLSHYGMNGANGIYSMAYRVINIAAMPIRSIQSAALPRYCRIGEESIRKAMDYAVRIVKRTSLLGVGTAVVLWFAAPLMPMLVGKGFAETVTAIRLLCLLPLFRALHYSAGDAIAGAGYQSHRFVAQLIAAVGNFGINLWIIPRYGWVGAAWSSLATDGALGVMNWVLLKILVDKSERARASVAS